MKPVLTSRNVMRVELHTRPVSERSRRGLATPFVAFEIVYTSLTTNGSSGTCYCLLSSIIDPFDPKICFLPSQRVEISVLSETVSKWPLPHLNRIFEASGMLLLIF